MLYPTFKDVYDLSSMPYTVYTMQTELRLYSNLHAVQH